MSPRARLVLWAPVALLLAFEAFLSSQSRLPDPGFSFAGLDKLEHAGYLFLTGLLAVRAARFGEGWSRRRTASVLLLAALVWGSLDELHQSFVPMRSVEFADVLADTAGVVLAVIFGEWILRRTGLDRTVR
ncbi:MAG TPA: VanZ family protein [Thermoanaerobaculia bacterium]|nr:VanZ family protein [Thermoanaerobaculia bacterium]HQR67168.1 VanZ family protein [Thermoanaerobaculia bacterium]